MNLSECARQTHHTTHGSARITQMTAVSGCILIRPMWCWQDPRPPHKHPYHLRSLTGWNIFIYKLSISCHCFFLQEHKWLKSAGWVFSAWKQGCVIYRRLWQNCPEWVLSLSSTTVNSSDTPWDPHNYTLLIPISAIFSQHPQHCVFFHS